MLISTLSHINKKLNWNVWLCVTCTLCIHAINLKWSRIWNASTCKCVHVHAWIKTLVSGESLTTITFTCTMLHVSCCMYTTRTCTNVKDNIVSQFNPGSNELLGTCNVLSSTWNWIWIENWIEIELKLNWNWIEIELICFRVEIVQIVLPKNSTICIST